MTEPADRVFHRGVTVGESRREGPRPAFDFRRLSDYGVLWLLNRVVFHPRGFALALEYADGVEEPFGWSIRGNGEEVWRFEGLDEDDKFLALEGLLDQARQFGKTPNLGPDDFSAQEAS